jgi:hypothetical protein
MSTGCDAAAPASRADAAQLSPPPPSPPPPLTGYLPSACYGPDALACYEAGTLSGSTWADASANHNDLTLSGTFGATAVFNAPSGVLFGGNVCATRAAYSPTLGPAYSVLLWVWPLASTSGQMLFEVVRSPSAFYGQANLAFGSFWDWDGTYGFQGSITGGTNPKPGGWRHIAFVRNGTSAKFYYNGAANGTLTASHVVTHFGTYLTLGCDLRDSASSYTGQGYLNGTLGQVVVLNTALSDAAVAAVYSATRPQYSVAAPPSPPSPPPRPPPYPPSPPPPVSGSALGGCFANSGQLVTIQTPGWTRLCVDTASSSMQLMTVAACDTTRSTQQWTFLSAGTYGYTVKQTGTGGCFNVYNGASVTPGARVGTWYCSEGGSNMGFLYQSPSTNGNGGPPRPMPGQGQYVMGVGYSSAVCVSINATSMAVQLDTCSNAVRWYFTGCDAVPAAPPPPSPPPPPPTPPFFNLGGACAPYSLPLVNGSRSSYCANQAGNRLTITVAPGGTLAVGAVWPDTVTANAWCTANTILQVTLVYADTLTDVSPSAKVSGVVAATGCIGLNANWTNPDVTPVDVSILQLCYTSSCVGMISQANLPASPPPPLPVRARGAHAAVAFAPGMTP